MIIKGWNKTIITRKFKIDSLPNALEPANVVTPMFNMTQQIEKQTQDDMDIDPTPLLSTITQCLMLSVCNKVELQMQPHHESNCDTLLFKNSVRQCQSSYLNYNIFSKIILLYMSIQSLHLLLLLLSWNSCSKRKFTMNVHMNPLHHSYAHKPSILLGNRKRN